MQWYVLKVHKGKDNRVKEKMEEMFHKRKITSVYESVLVPKEDYYDLDKEGKRIKKQRSLLPGYLFLRADLDLSNETNIVDKKKMIELIREVPGCWGFLETRKQQPLPTSDREVNALLGKVDSKNDNNLRWMEGERVKIVTGPFKSFEGEIKTIDDAKQKLIVDVSIFGRSTPVDIDLAGVEKVV